MADQKQEKTVEYFSRWAKTYEKGPMVGFFATVHDEIIRVIDPKPADNILDVACGTGRALRAMSTAANAGRLAGVDMSDKMIEEAKDKARDIPNLEYHVASAELLPFTDGTFDHVTVMNAFHHFPNQKKALQEIVRVLRPGGHVYIADVTGHILPFPIKGNKVWNLIETPLTPQVNALSRGEFRSLYNEVGLVDVRQVPASRAHHRCGRYLLWGGAAQLMAAVWCPWLLASGIPTVMVGAGVSFPYLAKTITIGKKAG
jgi:ubiquinone/menaquinone biosynthesis C-methylase UbiE